MIMVSLRVKEFSFQNTRSSLLLLYAWLPALFFFKDLFYVYEYTVACTDGCEPSCGFWELNFRTSACSGWLCSLSPCLLQVSKWVVVSHHVVAGIWTQDLQKNSQCSYPLSHLTSPMRNIFYVQFSHMLLPSRLGRLCWNVLETASHQCLL